MRLKICENVRTANLKPNFNSFYEKKCKYDN